MNGSELLAFGLAVAAAIVLLTLTWKRDQESRRREFAAVAEWEQVKRDLGPRSIP